MAPAIPTTEPTQFVAGDTVKWTKTVADYPASDEWTLKYAIRGQGVVDVVADTSGSGYAITIPAAKTASLRPGNYEWAAWVEKDAEVYTVGSGVIAVLPNLQTAKAGDRVSHAERTLAVLEAAIEGRLTTDMESYSIGGRAVTKLAPTELVKLRNQYTSAVWRERNPGKLGPRVATVFRG